MKEIVPVREHVDLVRLGNREIYLVGTAHVSHKSAELADQIIRELQPDTVAVELCNSRYQSIRDPNRWKNTDIVAIIRQGKAYVLLVQLLLASYQKRLGDQFKIRPGAEMLAAIASAEAIGANVVLADRDVRTTLKRTWGAINFWTSCKLAGAMLMAVVTPQKVDEAEIERMKQADALEELMGDFSRQFPRIRTTLIDERDTYLAEKIQRAPGKRIVAILGIGHLAGVKAKLGIDHDLTALEELPPRGVTGRVIGWSFPAIIVGMIVYGFFTSGAATSREMIEAWVLITGFSGALGSALAMGHPLTVIAAFLAAPITSIHPFLASGWVSGLTEAMIRRPRVLDFETVMDDIVSWRQIFRNRVSRILLIIAFTNLCTTVGMLVGGYVISTLL